MRQSTKLVYGAYSVMMLIFMTGLALVCCFVYRVVKFFLNLIL